MTGQEALIIIDHLLKENQQCTLRDIQSDIVLQVLEGDSYPTIGGKLGYDADYVKQIAASIWQLLSDVLGVKVVKSNLQSILQRYQTSLTKTNWGEAIDVSYFYGRHNTLQTLQSWLVDSHCRMVGIFGWGGIGKTALSVKLAQQLESEFEYVVWRSLRNAPTPQNLLNEILTILTGSETQESSIASLMQQLRQKRCLLVLDNVESILRSGHQNGCCLEGYEDYLQIFDRISDEKHQSCLVITSREKPSGMAVREGHNLPVRSLHLTGLPSLDAQAILTDKGLSAPLADQENLIKYVDGNPLALKLVATNIQNLFNGDIREFLAEGKAVFSNLWDLLDQQFDRLSILQQQIMYWLAINREGATPTKLQAELFPSAPLPQILESLETLHDRSLLETTKRGLTQQPVIMEYVTDRFVRQIEQEVIDGKLHLFKTHACIEAQTQDYLRDAQIQLILQPLADQLSTHFGTPKKLQKHLAGILVNLRHEIPTTTGYACGNLLNLLCYLKTDLQGFDFSGMEIRQAYLINAVLHNVDFTDSRLNQTVFAETFGGIIGIAYSPDGKYIATSDTKGDIQIWSSTTLTKVSNCRGHLHWAWAVNFSPDGQYFVSAGDDYNYRVKLWDVLTGECLYIYTGHNLPVNAAVFSPDGNTIASSSEDSTIRLWRVLPGRSNPEIRTLVGHDRRVWSIAFSPDGRTLVSGGEDCTLRLWDVATGACLAMWTAHDDWIRSVAFNPDGQSIATGSYDRLIKIWDVNTSKCLQTLSGHQRMITKVVFSPDGQQLASSSFDQTIKLWEINSGECVQTFLGHRSPIWTVAFHPNGQQLASGSDDHTTKIWNLELGRCINTIIGYTDAVSSLSLSCDGRYLAAGYENKTVKVWDVDSGTVTEIFQDHTNRVWAVKFSPQNNLLASASSDQTIKLYDWPSGTYIQTLRGHTSWVWSVSFSPDGQILASSSYDQTIKIWDVATGECLRTIQEHSAAVVFVAFSPNGQLLASSDTSGIIKLCHPITGQCYRSLQEHTNSSWSVAFSSDSQWLISSSYDGTIKLWSVTTGECLRTFSDHRGWVIRAQFSPDDRFIISGGMDGTLKVWDVQSGQCLRSFTGHSGLIYAIEVAAIQLPGADSPKLVAFSGGVDEKIKVWDLEAAECLANWQSLRPYEGMKIDKIKGITKAQKSALQALGGVINSERPNIKTIETKMSVTTYLLVFKAMFWGQSRT
jgi:WD40 repeat protein